MALWSTGNVSDRPARLSDWVFPSSLICLHAWISSLFTLLSFHCFCPNELILFALLFSSYPMWSLCIQIGPNLPVGPFFFFFLMFLGTLSLFPFPPPTRPLPFYPPFSNYVYIHDLHKRPVPEKLCTNVCKSVYSFCKYLKSTHTLDWVPRTQTHKYNWSLPQGPHTVYSQRVKWVHTDGYFKPVGSMLELWTSCDGRKKP